MSLFDFEMDTSVAFSRFERQEAFNRTLFQGYQRARVLTYSASTRTILWLAEQVETLEVIMGSEKIAESLSQIAAYQHLLMEELYHDAQALSGTSQKRVFEMLQSGRITVRVLKEYVSHAKLYLLEGEKGTLVVTGSANLSERALYEEKHSTPVQYEAITAYRDDPLAFSHYHDIFEALKKKTVPLVLEATPPKQVSFEQLPMAREAAKGSLVLAVPVHTAVPAREVRLEKLSDDYKNALKQVVTRVKKNFVLEGKQVMAVSRLVREKKARDAAEGIASMNLAEDRGSLVFSDGFKLPIEENLDLARQDAALLVKFFEGYQQSFTGDVMRHQKNMFSLLSWLYLSPFMSDLLREGVREDYNPQLYPLYAVVMGRSSGGKTSAVDVFLRSMLQEQGVRRPGNEFGKRALRSLQNESGRLPIYFNDVSLQSLRGAASDIKNAAESADGTEPLAPMVFSLNGSEESLEDELRKRCFTVGVSAVMQHRRGTPEHTEASRQLNHVLRNMGSQLYQAYLARLLPILLDAEQLRPPLSDVIKLSASVLDTLLEELGFSLPWSKGASLEQVDRDMESRIRDTLLDLYQHNRKAFTVRGSVVTVQPGDNRLGSELMRGIPDQLLKPGSSINHLLLYRKELETFLGIRLKVSFWSR